jgi:hypothetical protein
MQVIQNQFLKFLHKIYSSVIMYDKRVICESTKQYKLFLLGNDVFCIEYLQPLHSSYTKLYSFIIASFYGGEVNPYR